PHAPCGRDARRRRRPRARSRAAGPRPAGVAPGPRSWRANLLQAFEQQHGGDAAAIVAGRVEVADRLDAGDLASDEILGALGIEAFARERFAQVGTKMRDRSNS